ncbi:hypothetical protein FRC02_003326 [Tulasnella sp. 418]|nr:hypothetical protein FRC02_003326 [Tulasnella sp. 418]
MTNHPIITGAPKLLDPKNSGVGPVPQPRPSIVDFVLNEIFSSRYVKALNTMFMLSQDRGESHFALGGIHWSPYRPWDPTEKNPILTQNGRVICTHGTVPFSIWHRPYVAAYEQLLKRNTLEGYNDQSWIDAAQRLRLPFWDWASKVIPPDEVINKPEPTITTPSGNQTVKSPCGVTCLLLSTRASKVHSRRGPKHSGDHQLSI